MRRSAGRLADLECLAFFFGSRNWSNSPYINHFISADTITPNYSNPQDLNRYSYVLNNPLRYTDPTGHNWEECGDRSGYRCKIHMKKVQQTKAKWAAEAAVQQRIAAQKAAALAAQNFSAQLAAAQFAQQQFMNSSSGVMGNSSEIGNNGISSGDYILGRNKDDDASLNPPFKQSTSDGPNNDNNPNIIRLPGVWQPENNQTLNPLGKAAILAFGAIAIAEIVSIGAEAVPANPILGGAILAVGIYGALTWWNIAQTPTQ